MLENGQFGIWFGQSRFLASREHFLLYTTHCWLAGGSACEKSNLGWPTSFFFLSYLVIFGVVFFPRLQAGETTRIPQRHCRLAHGVSQCFIYDSHPSLIVGFVCVVVFMQRQSWLTPLPCPFHFPCAKKRLQFQIYIYA